MDISPFRVGTMVGTKDNLGIYKIKTMGIYEEHRTSVLYSISRDFYIKLLLTVCYVTGTVVWELPMRHRIFEVFEIDANMYSIFSIKHNLDNSIEILLRISENR